MQNTINSATKCNGIPPPSAFTHCWRESVQSIIHSARVQCHGRGSARTTSSIGLRKIRCGLSTARKLRRFRATTALSGLITNQVTLSSHFR